MKNLLIIALALLAMYSCSEGDSVVEPEQCDPCTPIFHAESLYVKVQQIKLPYTNLWVWDVSATYRYSLEGCGGKIHTHQFSFDEIGDTLTEFDGGMDDCYEQINVPLYRTVNTLASEELFNGLDSVTVYFTLRGLFQQCCGGSVDSIAPLSWSDTVRVEVID